jgi:hypothetical protein
MCVVVAVTFVILFVCAPSEDSDLRCLEVGCSTQNGRSQVTIDCTLHVPWIGSLNSDSLLHVTHIPFAFFDVFLLSSTFFSFSDPF